MSSYLPRYTLRTSQSNLEKIKFIADENGRSANKEIELLIKKHICDYEERHGEINLPRP